MQPNKKNCYYHCLILTILLTPKLAYTQIDSSQSEYQNLNNTIEDIVSQQEIGIQIDWSHYTEQLEEWLHSPLNLNRATHTELAQLPEMNNFLINSFLAHLEKYGQLISIYELQAIPGMTKGIFRKIKPFITIKADNTPQNQPLKGPPLKTLLKKSRKTLTLRSAKILQQQKGYRAIDTLNELPQTAYQGTPYSLFTRFRMQYTKHFSLAIVGEKDAGEAYKWHKNQRGMDFYTGHLSISNYGPLKMLVIGDYTIQAGQGLVLSPGFGIGKNSNTVYAIKQTSRETRPYASANENGFFRGLTSTLEFKKLNLTIFYASTKKDASLPDSASPLISSLSETGLHRTSTEIERRKNLTETTYGARIAYQKRNIKIGTTHLQQHLSKPIAPSDKPYKKYDFSGNHNFVSGIDIDLTIKNINLFGESAISKSGGTGILIGTIISLDPKLDLAILYRKFDKNFHSLKGNAFAERPSTLQNETGIYLGIQCKINSKWNLSAYWDQHYFPWQRYQTAFPSHGNSALSQLQYRHSKKLDAYIRITADKKEQNGNSQIRNQQLEQPISLTKYRIRIHMNYQPTLKLSLRSRIEQNWTPKQQTSGLLLMQNISYKLNYRIRLTLQYQLFEVEDYENRIYTYENDVPGVFSIPSNSGVGSRLSTILQLSVLQKIKIWIRYSQSYFPGKDKIKSGFEEIQGSKASEVKLQATINF